MGKDLHACDEHKEENEICFWKPGHRDLSWSSIPSGVDGLRVSSLKRELM